MNVVHRYERDDSCFPVIETIVDPRERGLPIE